MNNQLYSTTLILLLLFYSLSFLLDIFLFQSNHAMKRRYRIRMKTNILKQRRLELGLTQQAVAIQLGMHIRQYQRFEYGEQSLSSCSMRTGLKICSLLKLDPFEVVLSEGSPSRP